MARIRIGDGIEARIELPKTQVVAEPIVQVVEKTVHVVDFDYSKIAPYIDELKTQLEAVKKIAETKPESVIQVIEKKEIMPTETKIVNIVTHDKEDIKHLESEIKYIYDELKSDITAITEANKYPQITVVDTSDELIKLNNKIDKLKKQNTYLLCAVVIVCVVLNLI